MCKLAILAGLCVLAQAGLVKVPKIYNALISSDKNLTPSQAIPVVEPVVRTTALGVAFPPIFIEPHLQDNSDTFADIIQNNPTDTVKNGADAVTGEKKQSLPQLSYYGSLSQVAINPYMEHSFPSTLLFQTLPYYQYPLFTHSENLGEETSKEKQEHFMHAANFNKNPEIPDVPPPPLPIKSRSQTKA